jgi:vacuolar iron transporter family protein
MKSKPVSHMSASVRLTCECHQLDAITGPLGPNLTSSFASGVAFFVVGAIKGRLVEQKWFRGGAETFIVGGAAAALAYLVGIVLKSVVA